jgi:hypothetical protein
MNMQPFISPRNRIAEQLVLPRRTNYVDGGYLWSRE